MALLQNGESYRRQREMASPSSAATLISFVIYLLFTASPYQVRSSDASARQLTVGPRLIFNLYSYSAAANAEVPSVRVATTLIMTPNSGSSSLPRQLAN